MIGLFVNDIRFMLIRSIKLLSMWQFATAAAVAEVTDAGCMAGYWRVNGMDALRGTTFVDRYKCDWPALKPL